MIGPPTDFRKVASAFDDVESVYVFPTKATLSTNTRSSAGPGKLIPLGVDPEHGQIKANIRLETG